MMTADTLVSPEPRLVIIIELPYLERQLYVFVEVSNIFTLVLFIEHLVKST